MFFSCNLIRNRDLSAFTNVADLARATSWGCVSAPEGIKESHEGDGKPKSPAPENGVADSSMKVLQLRPTLRVYLIRFILAFAVFALVMGAALFYRQALLSLRDGRYLLAMILGLDAVFLVAEVLPPLIYVRSHSYFVGSGKVEARVGVFSRSVRAISIPQIREIEVRQGAMGRLMGYGDVRVLSGLGASEDIFMKSVRNPMRVKSLIEELMGHSPAYGEMMQEKNEK